MGVRGGGSVGRGKEEGEGKGGGGGRMVTRQRSTLMTLMTGDVVWVIVGLQLLPVLVTTHNGLSVGSTQGSRQGDM